MTALIKNDLCWVFVKLFGAILFYYGVTTIYSVMVSWLSLSSLMEGIPKRNQEMMWVPVKTLLFGSFLPLVLGLRLLSSGTTLHGCLDEGALWICGEKVEVISGYDLAPEEQGQFDQWIEKNPEILKRSGADRMALFRDAQKAAEFSGPEDEGFVEHAALFEVLEEGTDGLVACFGEAAVASSCMR